MANGSCRMHGGTSPGAPKGNQNAFKHGHYSAKNIAVRQQNAALLREIRETVSNLNYAGGPLLHWHGSDTETFR